MEKKPILKLRVYRGREVNYDANGGIKNENHLVSLEYKSRNWVLFMKNLSLNGYCKVSVEKGYSSKDGGYQEIENLSDYEIEVQNALFPKKQQGKTADQLKIEALEAKMAQLMDGKETKKEKKSKQKKEVKEVEKVEEMSLRDIYIEEVGKKPYGGWDDAKIQEKLNEFRASK